MEPRRIDGFAGWQIVRYLVYPLFELPACASRICALAMIETDRKVNECLEKESPRPNFFRPSLFQHFMALEKLAVVKERDSLLQ